MGASPTGISPVCIAIEEGHSKVLEMLLDAKGNPNQMMEDGSTPVLRAAQTGGNALVLLLEHRGDVNHANEDGATLVYMAAAVDDAQCLQRLLDAGADETKARDGG